MTWRQHYDLARYRAAQDSPYLASALWALRGPYERPLRAMGAPGVLGVDAEWRVYLDPSVVDTWSVAQLATALRHETWHCVRDHAGRRGDRQPDAWNISTDVEINGDMAGEAARPVWPHKVVTPETIGSVPGLTAEEYYTLLPEGEGEGEGEGSGSNSDGVRRPWEQGQDVAGEGMGKAEQNLARDDTAHAISAHAKGRGHLPAGMLRWAEQRLQPPKVPWQRLLAACLRGELARAGSADYTYSQPARRRSPQGVILPGMRSPRPEVGVAIDTSGSMSREDLEVCLIEVRGVCRAVGARVSVTSVDADVHGGVQRVLDAKQIQLAGGGGTDMGVGIEALAKARPRPHVIVILTDGWTPYPTEPPRGIQVVVCLIGAGHAGPKSVPTWARAIEVEP